MQTVIPRAILLAATLLLAFFGSGCSTTKKTKPGAASTAAAAAAPTVETVRWLPAGSRVAMLPIYTKETLGSAQQEMDPIFRGELTQALRCEIVQVSRPELMAVTRREQISSTEAIPPEAFRALQEKYGVNAVLFTDLTLYRPYRPIAMGVRSKLVSMSSLEVIWAADRIVDTADIATAEAAIRFGDPTTKSNSVRANQVILQSPRRFAAFVAHEVYSTLPGQ